MISAEFNPERPRTDETRSSKNYGGPTFSGPCLRLNEVIRFLGYEKVREINFRTRYDLGMFAPQFWS
jgi:hypothetical protein